MDRSDIAYLVSQEWTADELGIDSAVESERMIYVQVTSVNYTEWFEGGRIGLNPEFRFITNRFDYNGEEVIRYNGKYYRIYRTYVTRNDDIELYCERREGDADH